EAALVGRAHAAEELAEDRDALTDAKRPAALLELALDVEARDVLHDEVEDAVVEPGPEDPHDVRVLDLRAEGRLAQEVRDVLLLHLAVGAERLDRDDLAARAARLVDDALRALAEHLRDD